MSELTIIVEGPAEEFEIEWIAAAPCVSPAAQAHLDSRWATYLTDAAASGRSLFNGQITRLILAERRGRKLRLVLGPADYKTFLVTVVRDRAWFLQNEPEAMAFGLGNSTLLTQGNQALLGVRSPATSAYGGRAHVLGGVLERMGTAEFPASIEGIVTHLRHELHEEAAINPADLSPAPTLLAVMRDEFLSQPELTWQWEVRGDLRHIAQRLDAQEHHGALIVEKEGVSAATFELMTPVARAAWERWRSR